METASQDHHPIMQLRDDILNFLEAINPPPDSEINETGTAFAELLSELHEAYMMEYAIEHMESCFHCPSADKDNPTHDTSNHPTAKKESGQRKKGN